MGQCVGKPSVDEAYLAPAVLKGLENIDLAKLKKLIRKGHLAPCYEGVDEGDDEQLEECPICFLHYPALNTSDCCTQRICTECILKVQVSTMDPWPCPFCKSPDYTVKFTGPKSNQARERDRIEQQKVQEARERERQDEILRDQERELQRIQAQMKSAIVEPATADSTPTGPSAITPLFPSNPFEEPRQIAASSVTPTSPPVSVSHQGVAAAAAVMRQAEQNDAATRYQMLSHMLVRPPPSPLPGWNPQEWAALQQQLSATDAATQEWTRLQQHLPQQMLGISTLRQLDDFMLEQALRMSLTEATAANTSPRVS